MLHSQSLQEGAIVAREASSALIELKLIVDRTAEAVRAAEREAVGMAIGNHPGNDPLTLLRAVAQSLDTDLGPALSQAKAKTQAALQQLSSAKAKAANQ